MFLRAQFSAQVATVIDFMITILLAKFFGIYYVYATCIGSICGGIFNCVVNYEWTFKSKECKKTHVVIKYILVWVGSVALNTFGTYSLTEFIMQFPWVKETLSHYSSDLFILPKIVVSLLIAVLWNYQLQRLFVYRNLEIRNRIMKRE